MSRPVLRLLAVALLLLLTSSGIQAIDTQRATACPITDPGCDDGGGGGGGDDGLKSDGIKQADYTTPTRSCSVYANGGGMGSYCVLIGAGNAQTLRERFGNQKLQRCRYSEIPPNVPAPFNSRPGEGRYMLMSCLGNIDFDTYSGGPNRTLDLSVVFVKNGTDVADRHNGITDFLWREADSNGQMPVPFMRTRPNVTPLVGIPTYFTFRWLDPSSHKVVAQGPFEGKADGGPYKQITSNGLIMRARATRITVDPNQRGIKPVRCDPSTPYREGATPAHQPANACAITFDRSSASARKYASEPIPSSIKDAFYATVEVIWRVTYGEAGGAMRTLGTGFTMRIHQVLPVQEVQAPNQPPAVIY